MRMEEFATSRRLIAIVTKIARQRTYTFESRVLSPVADLRIDATIKGTDAGQNRRPRWQTRCTWRMGIREQHAPLCKGVDIGRLRLRMSAQGADPGIQVVNGDEQHIQSVLRVDRGGCDKREQEQKAFVEHQNLIRFLSS